MSNLKKGILGSIAATAALLTAVPAEARHGERRHHGNGSAVAAGVAGLALGAIIGSSGRGGGGYYDPYYRGGGYDPYYQGGYDPYYRGGGYDPYYQGGYRRGYNYDYDRHYYRRERRHERRHH